MTRSTLIRSGISLLLLVVAVVALRSQLSQIQAQEVIAQIRSIPNWRISAAACITGLNYLQLTFYDLLGLAYVKRGIPYSKLAPAAFVAIAFGHNIGPSILSGGSVRYRFYSERGLSAHEIARLIGFVSVTFCVGYASVAGVMLSLVTPVTKLPVPLGATRAIGLALLALAVLYVVLSVSGLQSIRIRKERLEYPKPSLATAQICVAVTDWLAMALVLVLLLPIGLSSYWDVLRMLLIAQVAGMLSQVPGGLGVFESLMVASLAPAVPVATVIGTLVVFRLIYNIAPLAVAILGLAGYELGRHAHRHGPSRNAS
jgi:uncharacterized membrane protein YbhN (UPF0104 family)